MENQNLEKQNQNEDEINLMDYIRVVWRRKKGILAIFLAAVIIVAIISIILPQTFEATSLVQIGQVREKNIESEGDIEAVFSQKATLEKVAQKLNLPPETEVAHLFSVELVEESGLLKIKGLGATPAKAVEVTNAVTEVLIARHQKLFAEAEKTFDAELETIQKNKEKTEKDIEQIEEDVTRLESDIEKYEREIRIRANAQSEAQGRIVESYIHLLASTKNQKESKDRQILDLEQKLVSLDQSLQQKEYERAYQTKLTAVEIPAVPPKARITPKRKQNVMVAALLGLFIGVLYAFAAEYWQKNKHKLNA